MESFNELCLKWWEGFYSSFQNSCTMTCISENKALDVKHGEMSILLGLGGGSESSNLLDSCGIPNIDIIQFNQVLYHIETLYLPKIILMYEQYKSSLHLENESKEGGLIVNSFQFSDGLSQQTSPSDSGNKYERDPSIKHLEIISAGDVYCPKSTTSNVHLSNNSVNSPVLDKVADVPPMTVYIQSHNEDKSVMDESGVETLQIAPSEDQKKHDVGLNVRQESLSRESAPEISLDKNEKGKSTQDSTTRSGQNSENTKGGNESVLNKVSLEQDISLKVTKQNQPNHDMPISEMDIKEESSSDYMNLDKNINHPLSQVRRSSRQIRVSARFADDSEVIKRLIKPEISVVDNVELLPEEKFPIVCSNCRAVFPDSAALFFHWKSHKHKKTKTKCLPFFCHSCQSSFADYQSLKTHSCSRKPQSQISFNFEKEDMEFEKNNFLSLANAKLKLIENETESNAQENNLSKDKLFICELCSLSFQSSHLLKTHFKTHGDKPYKCSECAKEFRRKNALLHHISKKHDNIRMYQCEKCPKAFFDVKTLEKHLETQHSDKKSFFCEVCGKGFNRQQSLINHQRLHERAGEFQCPLCKKIFFDKRSLDSHHSVHTGEKPHVCEVCGKRFRIARGLINHSRIHDKSAHLKCEQCPKTFIEKRSLEAHKLAHSGVKPFVCSICGKAFRRKLGLLNHSRLHDQSKAFKCDICSKSFVDKWGMLKHMTIHTGEKPFTCDVCGKSFRIKKGLLDHVKLHNKDLQLKCDLCPRTFVEKRKLDIHLRAHRGEKAYVCDQCGQRFMNSMTLKVHKRRHTGEKPYKCSFCEKAFNQQGTLIAHERYHKGERPYVCEVCGEGYVTKSHLTIHRRKHGNDRPYKCQQCPYAAFTFSLLRTHMLKHSTEKPYKCQVCPAAFKRPHHLEVHNRTHLAAEKFSCEYCDETFDSNKKFSAHLATHEIVVVTSHPTSDEIFNTQGPGEVAYDIVLLS